MLRQDSCHVYDTCMAPLLLTAVKTSLPLGIDILMYCHSVAPLPSKLCIQADLHGLSELHLSKPSACCRNVRPGEESSQSLNANVDPLRAAAAAEQGGEVGQDASEDCALCELD